MDDRWWRPVPLLCTTCGLPFLIFWIGGAGTSCDLADVPFSHHFISTAEQIRLRSVHESNKRWYSLRRAKWKKKVWCWECCAHVWIASRLDHVAAVNHVACGMYPIIYSALTCSPYRWHYMWAIALSSITCMIVFYFCDVYEPEKAWVRGVMALVVGKVLFSVYLKILEVVAMGCLRPWILLAC